MEFIDRKSDIELRLEEYDTRRLIHLSRAAHPASQEKSPNGFSIGRWEGKTLIVETTRISARYLNNTGVPLGPQTRLVERFTPREDGTRLEYSVEVTDAEVLTRPVGAATRMDLRARTRGAALRLQGPPHAHR